MRDSRVISAQVRSQRATVQVSLHSIWLAIFFNRALIQSFFNSAVQLRTTVIRADLNPGER